jgi:metallo-beta-lactamase family protein
VLVDCGLHQGDRELRRLDREPFPVAPESIDAVVLTHAHVDHCGYLPALVRQGFTGPVVATPDTCALAGIVLPDSGHLQEEEAAYANRIGYAKHRPAVPLYTEADARAALRQLAPTPFRAPREVAKGVTATLRPAGHILGSASVTLALELPGRAPCTVTLSGDLGRSNHPLLLPPEPLHEADVVLVESTYGDRDHDGGDTLEVLARAITRTAERGGTVVIPAFAVDRTEVVLFHLRALREAGRIPELVPIYVDSPMALDALRVYRRAVAERRDDVRDDVEQLGGFEPEGIVEVRDVEGSKALDALSFPAIVVSASGMATGGRVLHHLARRLPDARSCVILVGFQAAQTRGRLLADGLKQIKMLGRYVRVEAEIVQLPALSVHADRGELLAWLVSAGRPPDQVYVVHGEPAASAALASAISEELGWNAVVPTPGERVRLA